MACMCGDTGCPSCGPAQGYNPEYELACEWISEVVLRGLSPVIDANALSVVIADGLGGDQEVIDAVISAARRWRREEG